jgi:RNA 3'-terminal phosphate cyclase
MQSDHLEKPKPTFAESYIKLVARKELCEFMLQQLRAEARANGCEHEIYHSYNRSRGNGYGSSVTTEYRRCLICHSELYKQGSTWKPIDESEVSDYWKD